MNSAFPRNFVSSCHFRSSKSWNNRDLTYQELHVGGNAFPSQATPLIYHISSRSTILLLSSSSTSKVAPDPAPLGSVGPIYPHSSTPLHSHLFPQLSLPPGYPPPSSLPTLHSLYLSPSPVIRAPSRSRSHFLYLISLKDKYVLFHAQTIHP